MKFKFLQNLRLGLATLNIPPTNKVRDAFELARGRLRSCWRGDLPSTAAFLVDRIRGYLRHIQPASLIVITVGGVATVSGFLLINDFIVAPFQRDRLRTGDEISTILAGSIKHHVDIAESVADLFRKSNSNVGRRDFYEFAKTLPRDNPGLSALEWLPRVSKARRRQFEKRAKADGLFDFQITDPGVDGHHVKAAQRAEYYPVYFVEPYAGNEAVLGLDIAANSEAAAYLARVRDGGKTSAMPAALTLGDEADASSISIVVPIFRANVVPSTVAERRNTLSGFVRVNFNFSRLFDSLLSGVGKLPALEVYIIDHQKGGKLSLVHYFSPQTGNRPSRPIVANSAYRGALSAVDLQVAGHDWTIIVKSVPDLVERALGVSAWAYVAFVILLTVLLLRYLETIRMAREHAEDANRAKSEFLAMMSHELRTPLNAVIGFSDIMIAETFGPLSNKHYEQYAKHIQRSGIHLLEIIDSILDLSKIEAGFYKLNPQNFLLGEIWDTVHAILQGSIGNSGVTITKDLAKSQFVLHADPRIFRQVLLNLVSNAIKFSSPGGSVGVTAETGRGGLFMLRVTDTGIGIAREDLELVLKPFHQVDNSLSRKFQGIGLGLPLTRKLVELHGGKMEINSRLGEGTEIILTFPSDIVIADDVGRYSAFNAPDSDTSAGRAATTLEKKHGFLSR